MKTDMLGRVRIAFLVAVTLAVPLALMIHARAVAYAETQAAREAVVRILAALPQADPVVVPEVPGVPATDVQTAAFMKTVEAFQQLMGAKNAEGAWEFIHPDSLGKWTKDSWAKAMGEGSGVGAEDLFDSPFGIVALGRNYTVVDVRTEGASGWVHLTADVEAPGHFVLRRAGGQWLIDLEQTDRVVARECAQKQIGALKGSEGSSPLAGLMGMILGGGGGGRNPFGDLLAAYIDFSSLPLGDKRVEVTQAKVAGDRAEVVFVIRGKIHVALPMKASGGRWDLTWTGGKILPPDADLSKISGLPSMGGKAAQMTCLSNLKQLGLALMMYTTDYDGRMPPADKWCDLTMPYVKNEEVYKCPSAEGPWSYAMNYKLSRLNEASIASPAETISLFETMPCRKNAWDDARGALPGATLANPPRHNGWNNYAFVDGHAKSLKSVTLDMFRTVPMPTPGGSKGGPRELPPLPPLIGPPLPPPSAAKG